MDTPSVSEPSLFLWAAASTALLHAMSAGLVIGFYGASIDSMQNSTQLTTIDFNASNLSWIASVFAIGSLVGSLIAGPCLTKLGPRLSLMINSLPYLIGWVLIVFGQELWLILIGRLIGGFSIGFSSGAVPVYVLEISTQGLRGMLGTSFQVTNQIN